MLGIKRVVGKADLKNLVSCLNILMMKMTASQMKLLFNIFRVNAYITYVEECKPHSHFEMPNNQLKSSIWNEIF